MRKSSEIATGLRILLATCFLACGSTSVWADELAARVKALEAQLAASLQTIERLAARVADLERAVPRPQAAATPAPAVAPDELARTMATLQTSVNQISDSLSKRGDSGLQLHGFADVGLGWSSSQDPRRLRGFNAGSLDIYLTPQLGDRVKSLVELVFEHLPGGELEVEAERLQIGYTVNDAMTLWLGRFHSPIGLWNTLYHHGANLQTSILRPRFIDFEDKGGILPTHTIGAWATGKAHTSMGRVSADLYLGNGPTIRNRGLDVNTFTDDNSGKLVGLNVGLSPSGLSKGLTVGVHALGSTVETQSSTGATLDTTRMRTAGAYFEYDSDPIDLLGEFYRQRNQHPGSGRRHSNNLWFVQASRSYGSLVPYLRYERVDLDETDDYFRALATGRSYRRAVAGVRYELDARAALKGELAYTHELAAQLIDATGAIIPFPAARYRGLGVEFSIAF